MNDRLEGIPNNKNLAGIGKYIFVSCWTRNSNEDITFWNMYTDKMRGVRIELESPIFDWFNHENKKLISEKIGKLNMVVDPEKSNIQRINYSDNAEILFPDIEMTDKGLQFDKLGCNKKKMWKFENEIRFKLTIFPLNNGISFMMKHSDIDSTPFLDSFFLKINDKIFENMKIVMGPKMQKGDKEIIEALVFKFNPKAKLSDSKLKEFVK